MINMNSYLDNLLNDVNTDDIISYLSEHRGYFGKKCENDNDIRDMLIHLGNIPSRAFSKEDIKQNLNNLVDKYIFK